MLVTMLSRAQTHFGVVETRRTSATRLPQRRDNLPSTLTMPTAHSKESFYDRGEDATGLVAGIAIGEVGDQPVSIADDASTIGVEERPPRSIRRQNFEADTCSQTRERGSREMIPMPDVLVVGGHRAARHRDHEVPPPEQGGDMPRLVRAPVSRRALRPQSTRYA